MVLLFLMMRSSPALSSSVSSPSHFSAGASPPPIGASPAAASASAPFSFLYGRHSFLQFFKFVQANPRLKLFHRFCKCFTHSSFS